MVTWPASDGPCEVAVADAPARFIRVDIVTETCTQGEVHADKRQTVEPEWGRSRHFDPAPDYIASLICGNAI